MCIINYDISVYKPVFFVIPERQLGVGAFGRVYKAELLSLTAGGKPTTVAVKTIKSKTNEEHIKGARAEVKILMHIGRHRNIINLLGVCSKDVVDKGDVLLRYAYYTNVSMFTILCSI